MAKNAVNTVSVCLLSYYADVYAKLGIDSEKKIKNGPLKLQTVCQKSTTIVVDYKTLDSKEVVTHFLEVVKLNDKYYEKRSF